MFDINNEINKKNANTKEKEEKGDKNK